MASSLLSYNEIADLGVFLGELDDLCLTIDHPITLSLGNCIITVGHLRDGFHVTGLTENKASATR
jgi:hypothetical protein